MAKVPRTIGGLKFKKQSSLPKAKAPTRKSLERQLWALGKQAFKIPFPGGSNVKKAVKKMSKTELKKMVKLWTGRKI